MQYLINNGGTPFDSAELETLRNELDTLDDRARTEYRNQNASAIAQDKSARKFLIVSGPGTGKSHLFLDRINHWYQQDAQAKVFVTSFVRKLVADLQNDIDGNKQLTDEQKSNITTSTLHKFARSIVEQNHGTSEWHFQPHFRIIEQCWVGIVWKDVCAFYSTLDKSIYSWEKFEEQLHKADLDESDEWQRLRDTYFRLCQFYNATGFANLILRAKDALAEDVRLNKNNYFIIDEYQDFNAAEDELIKQLVNSTKGLLVVGDDEQVLYEKLKSGKPTLIRDLYQNNDYANGMLPFCSRSSFHITKSAGHFIQQNREAECIEKIYLPIEASDDKPKVQMIACAAPTTAVDYIERFVTDTDKKMAIEDRKTGLAEGKEKDAFLLILTPEKEVNFYGKPKNKIKEIVAEYQTENRYFSNHYCKILNYYSLTDNPQNNFILRKILYYENIAEERVHELINSAIENNQNLCDLESEETRNAIKKCSKVKANLKSDGQTIGEKIESIARYISIKDQNQLKEDIARKSIIEHQEEVELEEIEMKKMNAVELMTIVGSKGLSADHVIIIGFDDVNMGRITKNAFYVAMTRARKSLHILTALKSRGAKQAHDFLEQLPDEHMEYYSYKKGGHKTNLQDKQKFKNYLKQITRKYSNI